MQNGPVPNLGRVYDILFTSRGNLVPLLVPAIEPRGFEHTDHQVVEHEPMKRWNGDVVRLVQDRADIDISSPEFNFVLKMRPEREVNGHFSENTCPGTQSDVTPTTCTTTERRENSSSGSPSVSPALLSTVERAVTISFVLAKP